MCFLKNKLLSTLGFAFCLSCFGHVAIAQDLTAFSFEQAKQRMGQVSPLLKASQSKLRAGEDDMASLKHLNYPSVSLSATAFEYQKTINVDLKDIRNNVVDTATDYLGNLPASFPPSYQDIVSQVTGQISAALPGLSSLIPDNYKFQTREDIFRPSVNVVMPLYTGGAIPAIRDMADARYKTAQAETLKAENLVQVSLVQAYFGVSLASQMLDAATDGRDAFDRYYHDAAAMERQGLIPHVRVLQVQVGRDAAERLRYRAELDLKSARQTLARLLQNEGEVKTTTPLFVNYNQLAPVNGFEATALYDNGDIKSAEATKDFASAAVKLAKAQKKPQAYAFGTYNFNRDNAVVIDPDWVVGVGVRYSLYSGYNRDSGISAARERENAAQFAADEARRNVGITVNQLYNQVEKARKSFQLMDIDIKAAKENVRVQEIAFKSGEGTVADLMTARTALTAAMTERAAAAYEYDLSLASLLAISNRGDEFSKYLNQNDAIKAP